MREPGVGDTIDGRYVLRREIARGGMGAVFEAEQHITGQIVALKLLNAQVLHMREAHERLLREARAISKARHRGIVRILDAGVCVRTGPYLALERLTGRTLDGILAARGPLPVGDATNVIVQVCEALSFVHAHGVVHRDLKPHNVFVALEDGDETVKLFDFGIAALTEPKVNDRKLTQQSEVLGTPEYMAPEQLFMEPTIDHRCDIYAAGITLYECLTGEVPWAGSYADVIHQLATRREAVSVRKLRPEVSAKLEAAVHRAIAFRADDRYHDAAAFGAALTAAAGGELSSTRLFQGGVDLRSQPPPSGGAPVDDDDDRAPDSIPIPLIRRQYERAPYQSIVALRLEDGSELSAQAENISEGGLLVRPERPLPSDEQVQVRFPLPRSNKTISTRARTRWVRTGRPGQEPAVGLEFKDLAEEARATIADYVSSTA